MSSNVVLVTIDSLRADRLGCYGYGKNTSPHLDALASQGVRFDAAFAPGIPTTPSFTTLLSGQHPLRHGVTAHASEQRLPPDARMAAQYFKELGYTTVAIDNLATQASGRGSWFPRGFDYYSSFLYAPFTPQSEDLVSRATSYIEQLAPGPFLLWLHLWDPHSPYAPPPPFDTQHYTPGTSGKSLREATSCAPEYYEAFLADMKLARPDDYDWISAQYDGEISRVDAQCGRLFGALKSSGVWDKTHVLALADHGEAFGEGGVEFDHHGLYDAVTRIPLVWKPASTSTQQASTCAALVSNEDILPTLLEACGGSTLLDKQGTSGRSFASTLRGEEFAGRERIVLCESTRQCSVGLRTRDWKLIQPIAQTSDGRAMPGLHGDVRDPQVLLFDLKADPREEINVAAEFPAVRAAMQQVLASEREQACQYLGRNPLDYGLSLPFDEFMARLSTRKLRG
jgi:arylsulfatase A-like enzyme